MPAVDRYLEVRAAISVKVIGDFRLEGVLRAKTGIGNDLMIGEEPKGISRNLVSTPFEVVGVLIVGLKQGSGSVDGVVVGDVMPEQVPRLAGTIVAGTRRHGSKIN